MYPSPLKRANSRAHLRLFGLVVYCLPALFLILAIPFTPPEGFNLLAVGCVLQGIITLLLISDRTNLDDPGNWSVIVLYLFAFGWFHFAGAPLSAVVQSLIQGILLGLPMILFARICLVESGAMALRQAHLLTERLARRRHWPADPWQIRELPEVRALREAVARNPAPIFPLLVHARPEVRMAGLAALEYRPKWEQGQPQYLVRLLERTPEPEVQAALLQALACVEERLVLEPMSEYLWSPAPIVRQAAADALLWNTQVRWPWIRLAVRQALANPVGQHDGSLVRPETPLGAEVLVDLVTWTAEKGNLGHRAALTLGVHFGRLLHHGADLGQVHELEQQLIDPHTPAVWRMEIARLLVQHREITLEVARILLNASNPAPLRLLAIEKLLGTAQNHEAVSALMELARLPNRELALAAAEVVQRRLGIDLGLARGQGLPPIHSRQAAEIVRHLLLWADHQDGDLGHIPAGRAYEEF